MARYGRILHGYRLGAAARRAYALVLLGEMLRVVPPAGDRSAVAALALNWSSLGLLLRQCSLELMGNRHALPAPIGGDWDRALYFGELADRAHQVARELRGGKARGRVIDTVSRPAGRPGAIPAGSLCRFGRGTVRAWPEDGGRYTVVADLDGSRRMGVEREALQPIGGAL